MTKVTANRIVGSRVRRVIFLAFAFINVNHIHHTLLRMSKPGMAGCIDDSMSNYWISVEVQFIAVTTAFLMKIVI